MAVSKEQARAELKRRGVQIPEQHSAAYEYARPFARAGKAAVKGLAGIGDLAYLPLNIGLAATGHTPFTPPSQAIGNTIDYYGGDLVQPRNNMERKVDAATEFVGGLASGNPISQSAKYLGNGLSSYVAKTMAPKTATEIAASAGAGYLAEAAHQNESNSVWAPFLAGIAGAGLGAGAYKAGSAAINPRQTIQNIKPGIQDALAKGLKINPQKVEDFSAAGIRPTLADVSDSSIVGTLQNIQKEMPIGGNPIQNAMRKAKQQIKSFFQNEDIDNGRTQEQGGELTQKGARNFQNNGKQVSGELQQNVARHLQGDVDIPVHNVADSIGIEMTPPTSQSSNASSANVDIDAALGVSPKPKYQDPHLIAKEEAKSASDLSNQNNGHQPNIKAKTKAEVSDELEPPILNKFKQRLRKIIGSNKDADALLMTGKTAPRISYKRLVRLRQMIDDKISTFGTMGDIEQGALKQLRAKIQQDIGAYFKGLGPEAYADWEKFNKYYTAFNKRNEQIAHKLLKNKDAVAAFKGIISGQKIDGRKAKLVLESLSPDEQRLFSSSLLNELGTNSKNQFSGKTFAKKFGQLKPEIQEIVLNAYPKETRSKLRKVLESIDHIDSNASTANSSRTAHFAQAGTLLSATTLGLATLNVPLLVGTAASVAAGRFASSKLFANPKFISWLADAQSLKGSGTTPTKLMDKLTAIAKTTPMLAEDVSRYVDGMNKIIDQKQTSSTETGRPTKEQARAELIRRGIDLQTGQKLEKAQSGNKDKLLDKIAYAESNNRANPPRNPNSSAKGMYQFTKGTWESAVNKYGPQTGITIADWNDPKAQRVMAKIMLDEAEPIIAELLGRKPNETELYATHFLGLGDAKKLLRSRGSNQPAARLLPAAAKANRSIFFKGRRPRSVDEVYQVISQKI